MHWLNQAWLHEDGSIRARWTVPDDNPVLNSLLHQRLLPPSVLIEILAQTAACGAGLAAHKTAAPGPSGRLVAIEHLSFQSPVQVGDALELQMNVVRQWQNLLKCRLSATVRGDIAALGVATFALVG